MAHQVELNLFDKKGLINFYSSDAFDLTLINWAGFFIIVIGTALGVVCVMFVFFIVSYNSSLTKKVNESTQALQKKNDELVQANEAKNLFLANISHEYRTPLNAIMGFCEIAQRESKEPQTHNYLGKIHDASLLLLGIVNDVLDFSKMQAGQLSLDACEFNPAQAAEAAVEMLRDKARDKGLTLTTHYEPLFSQQMEGDDIRFKQIIINLLNNALKFTEAGSITLDAKATLEGDTYYLTICVRDTGIGIASEHQTKLFQSFSQAESATTRKYGGTGLGLSIVKQLSNLMGGDATLNSELGKGSEFVVTLQLKKASQLTVPQSEKEESLNDVDLSGMNVLVVEDNKINQIIVEKHLQNLSVKCALANDGQDALDYLQIHTPDLILMDGGIVQVRAALNVLENELGLTIPVAGMVKDDKHRTSNLLFGEELTVVPIDSKSPAFYLVQRIQDEVHRFAITLHRQVRSKNSLSSLLDQIPGVGPKTRTKLLKHFGSLKKLKEAGVKDIQALGVSKNVALLIKIRL